jgi:predicted nucleotidyltransferase
MPIIQHLSIDDAVLEDFCRRSKIVKLELFGSALRDDFNEASDFDMLVDLRARRPRGTVRARGN